MYMCVDVSVYLFVNAYVYVYCGYGYGYGCEGGCVDFDVDENIYGWVSVCV